MDERNIEVRTRADNVTLNERINTIFDLMIKGYNIKDIVHYISSKTDWGVTERQIYNYCKSAKELLIDYSKTHREEELGKAVTRLGVLFDRTLNIQDYKTALAVQKEISEMLGLKAPKEVKQETKTQIVWHEEKTYEADSKTD